MCARTVVGARMSSIILQGIAERDSRYLDSIAFATMELFSVKEALLAFDTGAVSIALCRRCNSSSQTIEKQV